METVTPSLSGLPGPSWHAHRAAYSSCHGVFWKKLVCVCLSHIPVPACGMSIPPRQLCSGQPGSTINVWWIFRGRISAIPFPGEEIMTAGRSGNPIPNLQPFFWLRLPEDGEAGAGADWPRCCRKPPPDFPNAQRRVRARRVPPLISCSFHLQGGKKEGARPGEGDGFPLLFGMQKELQSHVLLYFLFLFFFPSLPREGR